MYDELRTFILKYTVLTAAGKREGEARSRSKEKKMEVRVKIWGEDISKPAIMS